MSRGSWHPSENLVHLPPRFHFLVKFSAFSLRLPAVPWNPPVSYCLQIFAPLEVLPSPLPPGILFILEVLVQISLEEIWCLQLGPASVPSPLPLCMQPVQPLLPWYRHLTQTPATEALNGCPHPILKQDCKLKEDGGSRSLLRVIVSSVQSREESTTQRRHLTHICHCFIPLHFLSQWDKINKYFFIWVKLH